MPHELEWWCSRAQAPLYRKLGLFNHFLNGEVLMGNPRTGEVYELAEGETPRPSEVLLTAAEANRLKEMATEDRIRELERLSAHNSP